MNQAERATLQDRLQDPDTFATTLLAVAIDMAGPDEDVHTWTPETLQQEFHDEFAVDLPRCNLDKLMAAIAVRCTDRFHKHLPSFIQICNLLAGDEFNPLIWNPATVKEMAWAITESLLLYPADEDEPFSPEICAYVAAELQAEGFYMAPSILRFAPQRQADPYTVFPTREAADAYLEACRRRAGEVDQIVQEGVRDLLAQLGTLPLQHGNTADLLAMLRQD